MAEPLKPVNLPVELPNLVGSYEVGVGGGSANQQSSLTMMEIFNNNLSKGTQDVPKGFPVVNVKDVDTTGRYPFYYPGMDNEEMYSQSQTGWEKAYNGVVKMAGVAATTFLQGTAGAVYGAIQSANTGEFASFYNNDLSNALNDWSKGLNDKYAHYKTLREREGSWWEPSNLFTGNFLWENIVMNLGFSVGTMAGGFAWGAGLKALGLTSKLVGMGTEMAAKADVIIGEAAALPKIGRIGAINTKLGGLYTEAQGLIGKGLLKSDRAIVATMGTIGEAGIESVNNVQEFRAKMIQNFEQEHGYRPNKEELDEIDTYVDKVGNWTFKANTALLSATNYIMLPKMIGSSFKAERGMLSDVILRDGKYISALPEKGFGKLLYKTGNVSKLLFNPTEGLEEGGQFAIQTGTQNYFDRRYRGQEADVLDDGLLYGIKEALTTDEGLLNIFIGGFSGALQTSGVLNLGMGAGNIRERGFTGYGGERETFRNSAIKALNDTKLRERMQQVYSDIKAGGTIQQDREMLIAKGDELESKDLEFDYAHTFIMSRLRYKAKDKINDEIDELINEAYSNEGFLKLQQEGVAPETDNREAFIERLNNLKKQADSAAKMYENAEIKYKGLLDNKGKRIYSDDVISKLVYAGSKINDYERRINQLSTSLSSSGVNVLDILNQVVNDGVPKEDAVLEALKNINESANINKDDLQVQLRDVVELALRRKLFINEYNDIKNSPKKYQEQRIEDVVSPTEKETILVKTKKGEKEVEIGEEYFRGKVVNYDEKGNEIYSAPIFKVLAVNEDGKIKIQESDGKIRDITPDEFEEYKVGKVSSTLENKKAKFFMENWNNIYEFNFGKGKKQTGRLEYSSKEGILLFTYKDKYGKIKQIEVTGDQFKAKKGYKQAMITPVGEYTTAQKQSLEEMVAQTDERIQKKREGRLAVLEQIFNESAAKQKAIEDLLTRKKAELNNTKNEIDKLREQISKSGEEVDKRYKTVKFKSSVRKVLSATLRLSRTQEQLENEIKSLEIERDDIEMVLETVTDMAENIDNYSTASKDFLEELNDEVINLEVLAEETVKQINSLNKLIDEVKSVLNKALGVVEDLVRDYIERFPNVTALLGDDLKFIPSKALPVKPEHLTLLEDFISTVEDGEITPNSEKLDVLSGQLDDLQELLKQTDDQIRTKQQILSKFQKIANDYQKQKAEEKQLQHDKELISSALGTADNSNVHTKHDDGTYEEDARKSSEIVGRSTLGINRGKPHQARANRFGARFNKLKNSDKLRGVIVTSKNEDKLVDGIGLMDFNVADAAADGREINKDEIIALVIVNEKGEPINEFGEPITENLLDNIIFQLYPLKGLKWADGQSAIRATESKEAREQIEKEYAQWRDDVLKSEELDDSREFDVSFGIVEYVEHLDEQGNIIQDGTKYKTRTTVSDAGLVNDEEILSQPLIFIPKTNNEVFKGTTHFTSPLGVPFLSLPNAYVPLQNKYHTEKEAETIFQAIHQLAKNMLNPEEGLKSNSSQALINYLKAVVYWNPLPKEDTGERVIGYNSVFWEVNSETGKFELIVSGKDKRFPFTPAGLLENKGDIMTLLMNMYNNVNAVYADNLTEKFEEIVSISPSGEIQTRDWVNYQAYLLSDKFIAYDEKHPDNGKARKSDEIPLTTIMRPLKDENDVNRTGIYFYTTDNIPEKPLEKEPEIKIETSPSEGLINKGKKLGFTPEQIEKMSPDQRDIIREATDVNDSEVKNLKQQIEKASSKIVADGKTINVYTSPEGRKINFAVTSNIDEKNFKTAITILTGGDIKDVVEVFKKKFPNLNNDEINEKVREQLRIVIFNSITNANKEGNIVREEESSDEESFTIPDDNDNVKSAITRAMQDTSNDDELALREIIGAGITSYEKEDWTALEQWLSKNFPNVPVYRVKNVIQAINGKQAFGMFKDGALYIYENAEIGTGYHEVFEAIWKMMSSPKEQTSVINEFKSRTGKFIDRPSGESVNYSDATPQQIKEQLAEEFRDYVQYKKIPAKPEKGRPFIVKLFSDIVNFIRTFFIGQRASSNVEKLFQNINQGKYKSVIPYETNLSYAQRGIIDIENVFYTEGGEFRDVVKLSDKQRSEIIQHMTYLTLADLIATDKSLFTVPDLNKQDLYEKLGREILSTIGKRINVALKLKFPNANDEQIAERVNDILNNGLVVKDAYDADIKDTLEFMMAVDKQWNNIVDRHQEYLKGYNIEFDENDNIQLTDEDNSGRELYHDATKIDVFKKANGAIKLLLATLPKVNEQGKLIRSSVGGAILLPHTQVSTAIMNKVHSAVSVDQMFEKLREMAITDPNYRTLYKRLTKRDWSEEGIAYNKIESQHGAQLLSAFWRTFKKANPEVKIVTLLENGEINIDNAHLSSIALQIRDDYHNDFVSISKSGKGYFAYDEKKGVYRVDYSKVTHEKLDTPSSMIKFLKGVGVTFTAAEIQTLSKLKGGQLNSFKDAVSGIRKSIVDKRSVEIAEFTKKVIDIDGRLLDLGYLRAILSHPESDSTFFNINNERTQSFIGTNVATDFFDFVSGISHKDELRGTRYEYLLTDEFAEGSNILKRIFTPSGTKISTKEELMRVGYVSGLDDKKKGKRKQSSKLTYKERLIQEINLNLKGWYLNLVPGDASIEWMLYMGNPVTKKSIVSGMRDVHLIFRDYFISELKVSRDARRQINPAFLTDAEKKARKTNTKQLRFFKSILGEKLHNDVVNYEGTADEVYSKFEKQINSELEKYIAANNKKLQTVLEKYGILGESEQGKWESTTLLLPSGMTNEELNNQLSLLTINYAIANIELHKLLYSDPYQYSDELKRIKNFNSPRQSLIHSSSEMNSLFNRIWNKDFAKNTIGWINFQQDYFRTVVYDDIRGIVDLPGYKGFDETDGAGIISYQAYKHFRIKAGEWNDAEESQYKFDMAYEKLAKKIKLNEQEEAILQAGNPQIKSAYTPIKPIVTGNKQNGNPWNDILMDKFALYPVSYRLLREISENGGREDSNMLKLYNKMQDEKIDYAVFKSARKVGATKTYSVYDKDGDFNTQKYTKDGIINVPFSIISIQAEVPSKDSNLVTRGSQVTKLVTMDFMDAGVPLDFEEGGNFVTRYTKWNNLTEEQRTKISPLHKEIKNNQQLLEKIIEEGYQSLLFRLGIKEENKKYVIENTSKVAATLREEILKREVNDNISAALKAFEEDVSVIEATPAYHQVRNILYSIADKEVISPKISGGMKVQLPSSLLESVRAKKENINGKEGYTSDILKFYVNDKGKRVCEIMVGRWFDSDKSDEELLKYFNESEEGRNILSGLAFRIPTQNKNSIDSFVIKQFLPREYGDSVIVPAGIVEKVGSDFDIDKLSIYFKNLYKNKEGNARLIPFLGYGKEAISKFREMYYTGEFWPEYKYEKLKAAIDKYKETGGEKSEIKKAKTAVDNFLSSLFGDDFDAAYTEDYIRNHSEEEVVERIIRRMYKQSLENEYIQSSQNLVSHEKNFDKLIKPNSAEQLKNLAKKIVTKIKGAEFNFNNVGNMLDREMMSSLRHAFVTGKYAIGIAAVNQTNHSLNQRQPVYIDKFKIETLDDSSDKRFLGDGEVRFSKYNKIKIGNKIYPTLSMVKNADGQYISEINGQFIDGYVDISKGAWIMDLGATPNVASTWLFLVKMGVPIEDVAYFMNQPIIRDYLTMIDNSGYSWLYIDNFVTDIKAKYDSGRKQKLTPETIPSAKALSEMVGVDVKNMTQEQKEYQEFMIGEFLKYSKMAQHVFYVSQGTNFDTANFNDPYLVFKKFKQLEKARKSIVGGVDEMLTNSFLGKLGQALVDIREAMASILKSDQKRVRAIIEQVLEPFVDVRDDEFVKIARKAVSDLFDYAVQTNEELNLAVQDILLTDGGVAAEMLEFVNTVKSDKNHPLHHNHVINILEVIPSRKIGDKGTNNIKIKGLSSKAYDQNNIIYAFREIRDYLKGESGLYNRLVQLAVLQSGLSTSSISFTSVIPYEDFERIYHKTLSSLEQIPELENFNKLNVFQRNNWGNSDIVPYMRARLTKDGVYNPAMTKIERHVIDAVEKGKIPQVMTVAEVMRESDSEHIVYSWELENELITADSRAKYPNLRGWQLIKQIKADMRKSGDFSYIRKGLFEKVRDNSGDAFITTDRSGKRYNVYKAINAWGDSYKANEFYNVEKPSKIDNGMIKVLEGADNNTIIDTFLNNKQNVAKQQSTDYRRGITQGAPQGFPESRRPNKECK